MRKLTIWVNQHGSYDVELRENDSVISASTCIPTMKEVHQWNHDHGVTKEEWLSSIIVDQSKEAAKCL